MVDRYVKIQMLPSNQLTLLSGLVLIQYAFQEGFSLYSIEYFGE